MRALHEFSIVLLHRNFIDFRKGIFGLSTYVQAVMNENPFVEEQLFVFCNRSRTALKILYWDKSGFALWTKILEKEKFAWPKNLQLEKVILSHEQLQWLLQGFDIMKLKPHKELHFSKAV